MAVEYDGGAFAGWQVQSGERTVQGELEGALSTFLGHEVRVRAAGRTDAGVHAAGQVVCFRTTRAVDCDTVRRAVNALVGGDVAVRSVELVADDFDPRRAAKRRFYEYRIWNHRVRSPFFSRYSWHVAAPLQLDAMNVAAAQLVGEHDFTSFRAAGCAAAHPIRRVFASEFDGRREPMLVYRINGTAFLRHMVRNIVGTLVEVGRGRRDGHTIGELLEARNRDLAGATAPAQGLCLTKIAYAEDVE